MSSQTDAALAAVEKIEAKDKLIRELVEALTCIAQTHPTQLMMNGNATTSDPDYVKFQNNHMIVANNALKAAKEHGYE